MKSIILHNWTFRRAIYFVLGIFVVIQSAKSNEWFGVIFGSYFAAMGLFSFGCAGGNCFTDTTTLSLTNKPAQTLEDVDFKEIK